MRPLRVERPGKRVRRERHDVVCQDVVCDLRYCRSSLFYIVRARSKVAPPLIYPLFVARVGSEKGARNTNTNHK